MKFKFAKDPFVNLLQQIKFAEAQGLKEPTTMSLATVSKNGRPNVRAVLFKGLVRNGLSFYTNYNSVKAKVLNSNANAALLFFWPQLGCQIRVIGTVKKLTRKESEKYFATRPFLSQISAWASQQSQKIKNFDDLNLKVKQLAKKYKGKKVACPEYWGGYHLLPTQFEFWFGKEGRLHERFVYEKVINSKLWKRHLKSP